MVRNFKNMFLSIISAKLVVSFANSQFYSLISSEASFIEVQKTEGIIIDNCSISQIYMKNNYFIFTLESPIILKNSFFTNCTIENMNDSINLAFMRVGSSLTLINSTFSKNNLGEANFILSENDNSAFPSIINVSNSVIFELNFVISQRKSVILHINGKNQSIFFSNNITFYQNLANKGLIIVSNTFSNVKFSELYVIENFGSDLISLTLINNILLDSFQCLSTNNNPNNLLDIKLFTLGNCLTVTDYIQIRLRNCTLSNNFAVSTASGIILENTTNAKLLGNINYYASIDHFECSNNFVTPSKQILINSGNCIVLYNYGILTISNGNFYNNTVDYVPGAVFSGNPCLISHNTNNNLTIINTTFIINQAFCQCSCLNFDGKSLIIINSSFIESRSRKLDSKTGSNFMLSSEGGSMNLGAENMIFEDVLIFNSSALKGAGLFIHNKNLKSFQNLYANRLKIINNQGFQTSGFEMDGSLLLGTFLFINCQIIGNSVEFYGVISTFYYAKLNLYFNDSNISENSGKSVGAAFSFCHLNGQVFISNTIFMSNLLNEGVFIGGAAIFVYGSCLTTWIFVFDSFFFNNYCSFKGGAIQIAYGILVLHDSIFVENCALIGGGISLNVFSPGILYNVVFKNQKNVNQGGGIHVADFATF